MPKRYISIWFRHLKTDWFTLRQPRLVNTAFVLCAPVHGRMLITAANTIAQSQGIEIGMLLADARAIYPGLEVLDDKPTLPAKLLRGLAKWSIRYTPHAAVDEPDGILLDVSGCSQLWGGDKPYLKEIVTRLKTQGYGVQAGMADTIGAAWALARYSDQPVIIENHKQAEALLTLPAASLRLEIETVKKLQKLGLRQVKDFIAIPRSALRRRFGKGLLQRLDQALGHEEESVIPVIPIEPYQERLPCLEPISNATGIEIALKRLLGILCLRLQQEEKGLRMASFKGYRLDGKIEEINIGTTRPTYNAQHLFKLFEDKLSGIEPALGIELFILEAANVEDISALQEKLWEGNGGLEDNKIAELIDRLAGKLGAETIHRYLPDEHHWPERSIKLASSFEEKPTISWAIDRPRPVMLLSKPEPIEVAAPIPDYPPMLFRYKGKLHNIKKADGPERLEREWWLDPGELRDYYCVEDEEGKRYWVFRSGHYDEKKKYQWFMYGFFG